MDQEFGGLHAYTSELNILARAGLLEGEPQEALKGFQEVISMEGEQGEWRVSSLNNAFRPAQCLPLLFVSSSLVHVLYCDEAMH